MDRQEILKEVKKCLDYLSEQQNNMHNYGVVTYLQEQIEDLEDIIKYGENIK